MSKQNTNYTSSGIGLGSVIAVVLSWVTNHSIWWCIVHAFFSWFYILYRLLGYGGQIPSVP
jgi:hypothetical protein